MILLELTLLPHICILPIKNTRKTPVLAPIIVENSAKQVILVPDVSGCEIKIKPHEEDAQM